MAEYISVSFGISGHTISLLNASKHAGGYLAALTKAAIHGVVQGVIGMLRSGGKFLSSFASAFVSSAFSVGRNAFASMGRAAIVARTAIMALVGGVTSSLTGGKFLNGAVTATFVHLFNAEKSDSNSNKNKVTVITTMDKDGTYTHTVIYIESLGRKGILDPNGTFYISKQQTSACVQGATVEDYFEWNLKSGEYAVIQSFNLSAMEANKLYNLAAGGSYDGGAFLDCTSSASALLNNIPTFKSLDSWYRFLKSLYQDLNKIDGVY